MRSEQTPIARRYGAALIFLLIGTLAGVLHNRTTDSGRSDILSGTVRLAVAPPAGVLGRMSRWVSEQTGWLFHGHAVAMENRRLRERVAQLEDENAALREAQINYDRLRADLKFVQAAKSPPLAADVTARRPDPRFDTLMISRGSLDGVRPNSVVVTPGGVVGHVSEVTPTTATVLMLTDQNSGVSGRVQRASSRAVGVCKGDYSPRLSMVYLPSDASIKAGDIVVTSGLGGVYPPGLVIGKVLDVTMNEGRTAKTARVRPAADFDRLEEVFVLP
jgi:rod shape-determining protein MreC